MATDKRVITETVGQDLEKSIREGTIINPLPPVPQPITQFVPLAPVSAQPQSAPQPTDAAVSQPSQGENSAS